MQFIIKYRKWIITALSVLLIAVIGFYIISILKFGQGIKADPPPPTPIVEGIDDENPPEPEPESPPEWTGNERVNIMLLGIDARGSAQNKQTNSDTMLVASIDPETKQAHLFSILRDTYVSIPGYKKNRINAAYALGGADLTMKTIEELLGIPIHYYVSIDFEGFIKLVDALGGVEFEVEKNMKHFDITDDPAYNINLEKGLQILDGNKALQYVRFRNDTYGDYTRTERQRNLLKAVAKEMLTFSAVMKLPFTLEKIEPYINTNMTLREMWALGNLGYKIRAQDFIGDQIPPRHLLREVTLDSGAEVITVDETKLQAYIQEKFTEDDAEQSEELE